MEPGDDQRSGKDEAGVDLIAEEPFLLAQGEPVRGKGPCGLSVLILPAVRSMGLIALQIRRLESRFRGEAAEDPVLQSEGFIDPAHLHMFAKIGD